MQGPALPSDDSRLKDLRALAPPGMEPMEELSSPAGPSNRSLMEADAARHREMAMRISARSGFNEQESDPGPSWHQQAYQSMPAQTTQAVEQRERGHATSRQQTERIFTARALQEEARRMEVSLPDTPYALPSVPHGSHPCLSSIRIVFSTSFVYL